MWDRIANEPVAVTNTVAALIAVAAALGAPISDELKTALLSFAGVLVVLIPIIRGNVTPARGLGQYEHPETD